jgi:hypothetical protein
LLEEEDVEFDSSDSLFFTNNFVKGFVNAGFEVSSLATDSSSLCAKPLVKPNCPSMQTPSSATFKNGPFPCMTNAPSGKISR